MMRPPRDPRAPLFSNALLVRGLLQGAVVLLAALGVFLLGTRDKHGEAVARSMAFITLVLGNLGLVLANRSISSSAFPILLRPNRALGLVFAMTLLALTLALAIPWLRGLFGFAPLGLGQVADRAVAAIATLAVNDLLCAALNRTSPVVQSNRKRNERAAARNQT
jgi:Ca2+-transporting ATPase